MSIKWNGLSTKDKVSFIIKTLEESEVSITDFARLTNISRTSLYAWKKGQNVADKLRLSVAFNYALRLAKAVENKRLPLVGMYSVAERIKTLKVIIAEMNGEMRG
jgi:predicted transcriptional regulator